MRSGNFDFDNGGPRHLLGATGSFVTTSYWWPRDRCVNLTRTLYTHPSSRKGRMAYVHRLLQRGLSVVKSPSLYNNCRSCLLVAGGGSFTTNARFQDNGNSWNYGTTAVSLRSLSSSPHHPEFANMSNEALEDTSTIPGWELIHSPPVSYPKGALVGTVVSDKMQKTVNVAVDRYRIHPKIRKRLKYTRKFFAHDEKEVACVGDIVMITPCHRISKHKHFMLREIIRLKGQL